MKRREACRNQEPARPGGRAPPSPGSQLMRGPSDAHLSLEEVRIPEPRSRSQRSGPFDTALPASRVGGKAALLAGAGAASITALTRRAGSPTPTTMPLRSVGGKWVPFHVKRQPGSNRTIPGRAQEPPSSEIPQALVPEPRADWGRADWTPDRTGALSRLGRRADRGLSRVRAESTGVLSGLGRRADWGAERTGVLSGLGC